MNAFGQYFRILGFGESHGPAMGVVIEGCPAGLKIDLAAVQKFVSRRRPGQSEITTSRAEADQVEVLSGIYQGVTLGTPIAMLVRNQDARSEHYTNLKPRPGHADALWVDKYGVADLRGGGRASGRETVARVMAAGVAQQLVKHLTPATEVFGYCSRIGNIEFNPESDDVIVDQDFGALIEASPVRCPDEAVSKQMIELLTAAKVSGQSYAGTARIRITNPPRGLGSPVFGKLKSMLAQAFLSVGATQSFTLGTLSVADSADGQSFHADPSHYGGELGGITTGADLSYEVHFKPTSSIGEVAQKGRHDPCIVPRAIVVLEAMTWLTLADLLLARRLDRVG